MSCAICSRDVLPNAVRLSHGCPTGRRERRIATRSPPAANAQAVCAALLRHRRETHTHRSGPHEHRYANGSGYPRSEMRRASGTARRAFAPRQPPVMYCEAVVAIGFAIDTGPREMSDASRPGKRWAQTQTRVRRVAIGNRGVPRSRLTPHQGCPPVARTRALSRPRKKSCARLSCRDARLKNDCSQNCTRTLS